ncbi:MAG: TatD family hydrolase [Dehalococcoidia bacterium]
MSERFETEARVFGRPLVDGHTHIDQYGTEELPALLERAQQAGVGLIIAAGTTLASCETVVHLAEAHPPEAGAPGPNVTVFAGVGLHPADLEGPVTDDTLNALRALAARTEVVEWSETGLDYMPNSPSWDVQQDAFRKQIRLAREFGLPLVTHSREADDDLLKILREEGASEVGGAWHYFGGDMALAEQAMELGFNISLAKPLLRLEPLQEVAAKLPLDHIVIETDSFPQPFKKHRERWTEPWHLPQVADKLAELQGTDVETVAAVTTANYLRMLKGRVSPDFM